jgi:GTPase SAR1 family protein
MDNNNEEFQFKFPFLLASIAKRGSGKSFLTKYLVHHWIENGDIDEVMAFTNTNELNKEYDYLKKKFILNRYDEKTMKNIMETQKKQIIKDSKKVKNLLVIMDDVIGSLDSYSPTVRELITQGRHYKISLILNIQISKREFSTDFRKNADYFLIGYNGKNTFKQLFEEFEFKGKLNEFVDFMHKNTTDYNFVLYINKVMDSYDINKRYRIIHAEESEELNKFKIK